MWLYCGREHEGAHGAPADARAAADVLDAQVGRSADLPATPGGLHARLTDVELRGRFRTEEAISGVCHLEGGGTAGDAVL